MSGTHGEIAALRTELWSLYRDLRDEEIDSDTAEVAVSILDTQVRLVEAEADLADYEVDDKQLDDDKLPDLSDKGHQSRRHPDIGALHAGG